LLEALGAGFTVAIEILAGSALRTNTNTVSDLNISLGLGANTDSDANYFVSNTAGILRGSLNYQC
jgi:hypothetical protein